MEKKINYYLGYLLAILSVIAAISLDQYTKLLAVKHLKDQKPIDIIGKSRSSLWYFTRSKTFLCCDRHYYFSCCILFLFEGAT